MTVQEAIKHLKNDTERKTAMRYVLIKNMAIKALEICEKVDLNDELIIISKNSTYDVNGVDVTKIIEKQIPMIIKEIHVDEYYCPACGAELTCNDSKVEDKYCRECGQRFEVGEED